MNTIRYTPERLKFEDLKQQVAALFIVEDMTYKAAVKGAIDILKERMHEETGEVCYLDYCPSCDAGCDTGHTYNPKYCCVADECPY
jgi:hypothetical protein